MIDIFVTHDNATHDHRFRNDLKNIRLTILVRLTTIEYVLQLQFYRSIIIIVSFIDKFDKRSINRNTTYDLNGSLVYIS